MIINVIGYTAQPLYLVADFFKDKAFEKMFGEGVEASYFNEVANVAYNKNKAVCQINILDRHYKTTFPTIKKIKTY